MKTLKMTPSTWKILYTSPVIVGGGGNRHVNQDGGPRLSPLYPLLPHQQEHPL